MVKTQNVVHNAQQKSGYVGSIEEPKEYLRYRLEDYDGETDDVFVIDTYVFVPK